nr:glycosyltransferase [Corynebacterium cyclohexanicum]
MSGSRTSERELGNRQPLRILHVTECYEAGVGRAVNLASRAVDHAEHYLLASGSEPDSRGNFSEVLPWGDGHPQRLRRLKEAVARLRPDLVHAHSSWAGMYARVLPLPIPVVYQPHCFAFDDPYRGRWQRMLFHGAEKLLSRRSPTVIVLSEHEKALALSLRRDWDVVHVPNVASVQPSQEVRGTGVPAPAGEAAVRLPTVAMAGRISRQKAPEFFAEVARGAARAGCPWRFVWIGDGEQRDRDLLVGSGVHVTGWLGDEGMSAWLARTSVYFHSAAYEGFPLSVLDAASHGIPVLARDIPCFAGTGIATVTTPDEALAEIGRALTSRRREADLRATSRRLTASMSFNAHGTALARAYESAVSGRRTATINNTQESLA